MDASYIIVLFKFAWPFLIFNIPALIVCPAGENLVYFLNQFYAERLLFHDFFFQKLIAQLLILLFKQGTGTSGIVYNPAVFKDFSCIVIGDFLILYLSGMERKQDAETVKIFI